MVANGRWLEQFPDAQVHHVAMSASDHCMLSLFLTKKKRRKPTKRRFVFEAMWTRDERCREVIERAWDPFRECGDFSIGGRIRSCQAQLQGWNRGVFGNVNKRIKVLKEWLNQLEGQNCLHETAKEILGPTQGVHFNPWTVPRAVHDQCQIFKFNPMTKEEKNKIFPNV